MNTKIEKKPNQQINFFDALNFASAATAVGWLCHNFIGDSRNHGDIDTMSTIASFIINTAEHQAEALPAILEQMFGETKIKNQIQTIVAEYDASKNNHEFVEKISSILNPASNPYNSEFLNNVEHNLHFMGGVKGAAAVLSVLAGISIAISIKAIANAISESQTNETETMQATSNIKSNTAEIDSLQQQIATMDLATSKNAR